MCHPLPLWERVASASERGEGSAAVHAPSAHTRAVRKNSCARCPLRPRLLGLSNAYARVASAEGEAGAHWDSTDLIEPAEGCLPGYAAPVPGAFPLLGGFPRIFGKLLTQSVRSTPGPTGSLANRTLSRDWTALSWLRVNSSGSQEISLCIPSTPHFFCATAPANWATHSIPERVA